MDKFIITNADWVAELIRLYLKSQGLEAFAMVKEDMIKFVNEETEKGIKTQQQLLNRLYGPEWEDDDD